MVKEKPRKTKKVAKRTKQKKEGAVKNRNPPKSSNILSLVASLLLLIYGLFVIIFPNQTINWLTSNLGPTTTLTSGLLITQGISWIILSFLVFLSNKQIRKTSDRSWMWFLLVLAIASIVLFIDKSVGMVAVIAGILIFVASIIYLLKKK